MKVVRTGNTTARLEKITWDDLPPCDKHGKNLECATFRGRYQDMKRQNACIDLVNANSSEEILKIWFEVNGWYNGFNPIRFHPNAEIHKHPQFKSLEESGEWYFKNTVVLNIVPENVSDVKVMNKYQYDILRKIAYDENGGDSVLASHWLRWVTGLKDEIIQGNERTPVKQGEYIEAVLKNIWNKIEKISILSERNRTFKSLVDEELERLILGKDLLSVGRLIEYEYGTFVIGDDENDEYIEFALEFIHRIIASDIAQIILDLDTGKLLPDTPDAGHSTKPDAGSKHNNQISFQWRSNPETELPILYGKMKGVLIAQETTLEQFTAIFTGQPIESIEPVEWIETTVLLAYFIDCLTGSEKISKNKDYWVIGASCFMRIDRNLTNRHLITARNNYMSNHTGYGKPRNYDLIDSLF